MDAETELLNHLSALAGGDESALRALYERLSSKVYTIALRVLENPGEAQEIVQDTFLQLYRKADQLCGELESVTAFTCTIARNLSISRLRARRVRPQRSDEFDVHDPFTAPAAPTEADPTERLMIDQALGQLEPTERQLLEASFFEGYTHQELCERYTMPLGSLKSKLRRSLLKLRHLMGAT